MFEVNMTHFVVTEILMLLSLGAGYYWGSRGTKGVVSDLNDVKKDLQDVKAKVSPSTPPQA